jgi:hypothetical protein
MRLTGVHLREAAIIGGAGLIAFVAMYVTYLIGHDSFFMPGAISAIFMAVCIFLLRRYEPRPQRPVDPRRKMIWFLSSMAAAALMAVIGLIATLWIGGTYLEPGAPCPARSSVNVVSPNGDVNAKGLAASPAEEKIAGAAARCRQPS